MSDDAEVYTVHLDRYHRHWPVVMWIGFMALTFAAVSWEQLPSMLLTAVVITGLFYGVWHCVKRRRIIVSSSGVVEKGWFFKTVVYLNEVRHHEMRLESDSLDLSDAGVGELLLSVLAQFTLRPMRWILRLTIYGGKSDVFYRGVLTLYGHDKERLIRIEASDGWEHIEDVFQRICHIVEQRATASSVTSSRS